MKVIQHKYRKCHKARVLVGEKDFKRVLLQHGVIGLVATEGARLTSGQLESYRRTIRKIIRKAGNVYFMVILDRPITAKPAEVRMGKGKGSYSESVSLVKQGTVLIELGGNSLPIKLGLKALLITQKKLPIKTKIIFYEE